MLLNQLQLQKLLKQLLRLNSEKSKIDLILDNYCLNFICHSHSFADGSFRDTISGCELQTNCSVHITKADFESPHPIQEMVCCIMEKWMFNEKSLACLHGNISTITFLTLRYIPVIEPKLLRTSSTAVDFIPTTPICIHAYMHT
jgi:hypothetical protein